MAFVSILWAVGKFIYGFIFGALIWSIVVRPYLDYYDFTSGSLGPMSVFATLVAISFVLSEPIRSIMVLYLPSLVGSATQNYILMLLFSSIVLNPVTNIGMNAIESVRVIGCSLTMTFDQLRERAKLVLNPIVEVLSDRNQTDLDPIRKSLFEIQQFVGKLQANINEAVEQTSRLKETSSSDGGKTRGRSTMAPVLSNRPPKDALSNRTPIGGPGNVDFEFDLENFGLKASVDVDQLRALARQGQLSQLLVKGNESLATSQVNISDVLYDSCVSMFNSAKQQCSEAVADMHKECQGAVGVFLATWWCQPFTYGLDKFCPVILDQLVDEKSVCKKLKLIDKGNEEKGMKIIGGANNTKKYRDVNEAFRELTQQIGRLNEDILSMDDGRDGDRKLLVDNNGTITTTTTTTTRGASSRERLRRFELSLTFNEDTRRIFRDIKQLIEFISDKYKLRRLFIDLLLLAYDIYTTYTFALILFQTWRYRKNYLADIKFDNCYITREFVELDRRFRLARGSTSVSRSATHRSTTSVSTAKEELSGRRGSGAPGVLPLTQDEAKRYISPFTCFGWTGEERSMQRSSVWTMAMFLILALSVLYLDNIFYSILTSIQEHSLIRFREVGHHELDIKVYGEGVIARLVRRLVGSFSSAYQLNRVTSTQRCLPRASQTTSAFHLGFLGLLAIYFLIDQLGIYAKRLRPVTCSLFYPKRERARLKYLHRFIRFQRDKLREIGVKNYLTGEDGGGNLRPMEGEESKEDLEEEAYSLREAAIYLRQCFLSGSQRYCSCLNRLLFTRRQTKRDDTPKLV